MAMLFIFMIFIGNTAISYGSKITNIGSINSNSRLKKEYSFYLSAHVYL